MTGNKRLRYEAENECQPSVTYNYDPYTDSIMSVWYYGLYEDLEKLEKESE